MRKLADLHDTSTNLGRHLQAVQANSSRGVDVWVIDDRLEVDFWWFKWISEREVNQKACSPCSSETYELRLLLLQHTRFNQHAVERTHGWLRTRQVLYSLVQYWIFARPLLRRPKRLKDIVATQMASPCTWKNITPVLRNETEPSTIERKKSVDLQ